MQATHVDAIDRTIQKTNEWLKAIESEMNARDRQEAYVALRATLHTLRDRLAPNEALHLGAELPALLRGVYYEGWRLVDKPVHLRTMDDFLDAVTDESGNPLFETERAVRAVFKVMSGKIARGEIEDVKAGLPAAIRDLWP